jgi:bifunctional UDP-N-acetylglucosamine pyrophosphorylase/glucosamine-1-phosphate N-acetyltransferase
MAKTPLAVVILAAGKGTRMKSDFPKVLHPLLGRPLLHYVLETVKGLHAQKTVLVIGHQAERVREAFPNFPGVFVEQVPQLGTGHALQTAQKELKDFQGRILVLYGDVPLIEKGTLRSLLHLHRRTRAAVSLVTTKLENPHGYGRIVRDPQGEVLRIVEEKDATGEERAIREVNTGLYVFESEFLFSSLSALTKKNKQMEYYLTDLVHLAREKGLTVSALSHPSSAEVLGINDREDLARSSRILREKILKELMRQGVTVVDPASTYIESTVRIGQDTVIHPFTAILGKTRIGSWCRISSHVVIDTATIRDGAVIPPFSWIKQQE